MSKVEFLRKTWWWWLQHSDGGDYDDDVTWEYFSYHSLVITRFSGFNFVISQVILIENLKILKILIFIGTKLICSVNNNFHDKQH